MIYEYECLMGHVHARTAPVSERKAPVECPCCAAVFGRRIARRILSPTPTTFHFNDRSKRGTA